MYNIEIIEYKMINESTNTFKFAYTEAKVLELEAKGFEILRFKYIKL